MTSSRTDVRTRWHTNFTRSSLCFLPATRVSTVPGTCIVLVRGKNSDETREHTASLLVLQWRYCTGDFRLLPVVWAITIVKPKVGYAQQDQISVLKQYRISSLLVHKLLWSLTQQKHHQPNLYNGSCCNQERIFWSARHWNGNPKR